MGEVSANTKYIAQGKDIKFSDEQLAYFWEMAIVLVVGIIWIHSFINR